MNESKDKIVVYFIYQHDDGDQEALHEEENMTFAPCLNDHVVIDKEVYVVIQRAFILDNPRPQVNVLLKDLD